MSALMGFLADHGWMLVLLLLLAGPGATASIPDSEADRDPRNP
jgi:hypothetical protein